MSTRKPRTSVSSDSTSATEGAEAAPVAAQPVAVSFVSIPGLNLELPSDFKVKKSAGAGKKARFPLEQLPLNGYFIINEESEIPVRRAIQQVRKKHSEPTGETKLFKGKEIAETRKLREFVLYPLNDAQKAQIDDATFASLYPTATSREEAVAKNTFAVFRTL